LAVTFRQEQVRLFARLFATVFRVSLINVIVVHLEILIQMLRLRSCSLGCAQRVNMCSVWK